MSTPSHVVYLRSLRAIDAPQGDLRAERPHDAATNHSEIHDGFESAQGASVGAESDTTLYWLMLVVGVVPVVVVLLRGGAWGVAPTVGALFCVFALRALVVAYIMRMHEHLKKGPSHPRRI